MTIQVFYIISKIKIYSHVICAHIFARETKPVLRKHQNFCISSKQIFHIHTCIHRNTYKTYRIILIFLVHIIFVAYL